MRIVLDTNVLVNAVLADGPPRKLLARCITQEHTLLESPATLQEFVEVIRRPKFRFIEEDVHRILTAVASVAELIEPTTVLAVVSADRDDDRFLELALDGRAELVVSGDRHLLALKSFRGIPIVKTTEAI